MLGFIVYYIGKEVKETHYDTNFEKNFSHINTSETENNFYLCII